MSFSDWCKYLEEIAKTKKMNVNTIKSKLVECGEPGNTGTVRKTSSVVYLLEPSPFIILRSLQVSEETYHLDKLVATISIYFIHFNTWLSNVGFSNNFHNDLILKKKTNNLTNFLFFIQKIAKSAALKRLTDPSK